MRIPIVLLAALTLASSAAAQTPQKPPADVVKQLFDAMRARDTLGMKATFHPQNRLLATGARPQFVPVSAWLRGIAGAQASPDERLFEVETRTDGTLATVWARYELWVGDQFSHCGYDAFQLLQDAGEWKVYAGGDSQRRDPARCGRGANPVADAKLTSADTAAVLAPLQKLFDSMATWDTVAIKSVFLPDARMLSISGSQARPGTVAEFIARPAQNLREKMYRPEVRISDNLATIWTFYDFHIGDRFSHCGIDYAQLAKTAEGWKIAQLSWTVRSEGCERVNR